MFKKIFIYLITICATIATNAQITYNEKGKRNYGYIKIGNYISKNDTVNRLPISDSLGPAYESSQNLSKIYTRHSLKLKVGISPKQGSWKIGILGNIHGKLYILDRLYSRPLNLNLGVGAYVLKRVFPHFYIGTKINHISNGLDELKSRGLNQAIFVAQYSNRETLDISMKVWYPFTTGDNPDIGAQAGIANMKITFLPNENELLVTDFNSNLSNFRGGSFEFGYYRRITNRIFLNANVRYGKGLYLIDYNFKQTEISVGLVLKQNITSENKKIKMLYGL